MKKLLSNLGLRAVGYSHGKARKLAEASRDSDRGLLRQDLAADETRFRAAMDGVAGVPHVVAGTTLTGVEYRIPLADLTSLPAQATAATGIGKSRFIGVLMDGVVRHAVHGEPVSVILIDGKGETAGLFLRSVAGLAQTLPPGQWASFQQRIHTLQLFGQKFLPSLPLLARMPDVPIMAQASAFAEILSETFSDAMVGPRQIDQIAGISAVSIEFGIRPGAWPWLLSSPVQVAELAERSSLPSVRLQLARFEREPKGSIDGINARLGTILRVPSFLAALSGDTPFDFAACFEPGSVTVIDFGGADLGARAGVRAMGSLLISALANAAFDPRRTVRGTTMIVLDEPQVMLTSVALEQLERLVTLGRSFGAGGTLFVHQGATQLPVEFQTILNTNMPLRVLGRSSERDAGAASEWLPRTGRVSRPREPGSRAASSGAFMNEGQEERHRIAEIGRLPPRHFLIADRRTNFAPRVVRAPDFNPPAWSAIAPDIAAAVRRGAEGIPRATLEARVHEIEAEASARFEEARRTEETSTRRRGRPPVTPDVVGEPRRRGRRGEVP